jgi:hypothetical protein
MVGCIQLAEEEAEKSPNKQLLSHCSFKVESQCHVAELSGKLSGHLLPSCCENKKKKSRE